MFDVREKCRELDVRVAALERATVSGVAESSIAERFDELHNRLDLVGTNIQAKIEREVGQLRTEMKAGFAGVEERFTKVDEQFDKIDGRFTKVNERFDKIEKRLDGHDERFDRIESILVRIDAKLTDQSPN